MGEIVQLPNQSKKSVSAAVMNGVQFLKAARMTGWPRSFEAASDYETARRLKPQIQAAMAHYEDLLQPHSPQEIATVVELLDIRGFEKHIPSAAGMKIKNDWLDHLGEYPADLIQRAYHNWIGGNNKRAPYGPGELMESVKSEFVDRRTIYMKAKTILEMV